jgi:hypothetical protein
MTGALQLDLFGTALSAEQQRYRDALVCLRDAMPRALEVVVALQYEREKDTKGPGKSGDWAYLVCRAGLRVESTATWYGWNHAPRNLVTWPELHQLIGDDRRRADLAEWADSLPMPRWQQLMRPHELWPDPEGWHTSYFCRDHVDVRWPARRRAWRLLRELIDDAIDAQERP